MAVENLGHAHTLTLAVAPERTSIRVIPRPHGDQLSLATDVLIALEKRRWTTAVSTQKVDPCDTAILWLRTAEIENIYVSNADWMDETQFLFAKKMSIRSSVWLLFPERARQPLVGDLFAKQATKRDLYKSSEMSIAVRGHALESDWEQLPPPPACSALEFRGRCSAMLSASQLAKVDDAMHAGAAVVKSVIAQRGGGEDVYRLIRERGRTDWTSLTMIHGAQIAALRCGWRLRFDRDLWKAERRTSSELSEHEEKILNAMYDPYMAMMYLTTRVGGLTASEVCELKCKDLEPSGSAFNYKTSRYKIPTAHQATARAFHKQYVSGRGRSESLFLTKNGNPTRSVSVRQRLNTFCNRTALGRPGALVERQAVAPNGFVTEFRPLERKLAA